MLVRYCHHVVREKWNTVSLIDHESKGLQLDAVHKDQTTTWSGAKDSRGLSQDDFELDLNYLDSLLLLV